MELAAQQVYSRPSAPAVPGSLLDITRLFDGLEAPREATASRPGPHPPDGDALSPPGSCRVVSALLKPESPGAMAALP